MGTPRGTGRGRLLARLLIRGPDAEFIRADLEESLRRDLERGVPPGRARRRYLANLLGSGASIWAARLSPTRLIPSWLDVKLGARMLLKHPGLTLVSLLALSIGIPLGLAPLWLADAVEADFPVEDADRVRALRYWDAAASAPGSATWYDYSLWDEELRSFRSMGAVRTTGYNVAVGEEMGAPVAGAEMTASMFDLLRVPPLMGRRLIAADETVGGADVAVIGEAFWESRLGGDPEVVGREISIAGVPHTVVGVMPGDFRFPASQQIWLPMRESSASEPGTGIGLRVLGRLADGVSLEEAQTEIAALGRRLAGEEPEVYAQLRPEVTKSALLFLAVPRGGVRSLAEFYLVQALSVVLLIVACVNVALLIFARTATRGAELGVRSALGASRFRIVSQIFTESLVLAMVAAGVGLLVLVGLPRLIPPDIVDALPYWIDFGMSWELVVWALGLAGLSAVVAGAVPAWRFTGRAVHQTIQRARSARSGVRFGGVSGALVVLDVAICVAVIGTAVGMADMLRHAWNAQDETVGFPDDEYLSFQLMLPGSAPSPEATAQDREGAARRLAEVQQALVERLEAEPGVRGVAVAGTLPRQEHTTMGVEVDAAASGESVRAGAKVVSVDVGFFDALGTPVLSGRDFARSDLDEGVSRAIVNESFVERVLGGRNPIGRRVRYRRLGASEGSGWHEIVGVVGRAGINIMDPEDDAAVYLPLAPGSVHPVPIAAHVGGDPESFTPRLRQIAADVDANALVQSPLALDRIYEGDWYFAGALSIGGLAAVTILLALAASGVYAIMSFTVAERTREIAIRNALGAGPAEVAYSVARRSVVQLVSGVAVGVPAAWVFYRDLTDANASTLGAFAASVVPGLLVLGIVGLTACVAPTLRALRIQPTEALKGE